MKNIKNCKKYLVIFLFSHNKFLNLFLKQIPIGYPLTFFHLLLVYICEMMKDFSCSDSYVWENNMLTK